MKSRHLIILASGILANKSYATEVISNINSISKPIDTPISHAPLLPTQFPKIEDESIVTLSRRERRRIARINKSKK